MRKIKSEPKKKVIEFLKETTAEDTTTFTFTIDGDISDAHSFVHAMRVELSRIRMKLKNAGYTPKPFKMLLENVSPVAGQKNKTEVVLRKVIERDQLDALKGLSEVLEGIAL